MRVRVLIVLVAVVGLATVVLIMKVRTAQVVPIATAAVKVGPDDELHLKVASLERQIASLRALSGRSMSDPANPTLATPLNPMPNQKEKPAMDSDPVAREQAVAARDRAQMELLHTKFEQESYDGRWADQAIGKLVEVYKGEMFKGVNVTRADCRSTMCRFEVRIDSPDTAAVAVRLLALKAPWSGQTLINLNTETGIGLAYLARNGHDLPQVTSQ
jgi:hypothetical protein